MKRQLFLLASVVILAACNSNTEPASPTPAGPTPLPPLPASPTVNPVMPTDDTLGSASVGASNPTQAGLAAEGEPSQEGPTITPLPTEARLPMVISTSDGLTLQATFYGAPVRNAPAVLMLHMLGRDRSTWEGLAQRLQSLGYAVLTIDLRGYGETGGTPDWTLAPGDVKAALEMLGELPGLDSGHIVVIGASIGANLGVNACADLPGCVGTVLLSPGLDYRGITTADAMPRLGQRPVLIVASENDNNNPADSVSLDGMAQGDHQLVIYPAAGHGTDMLTAEPGLVDVIVNWLLTRVVPPVPQTTPAP